MTKENTQALVVGHNELAWDKKVADDVVWTIPVSIETIDKARGGDIEVSLGANSLVPRDWFPSQLKGVKILCLASGGGQQGPILAAAGADVTVMDISTSQLEQDRKVADLAQLQLATVQGDMCDLSMFSDETFDIVFCPVSITYIPDLQPMYKEVYRVLVKGGSFMLGAPNPAIYLFDDAKWEQGIFEVANCLPFQSFDELDDEQRKQFIVDKRAIEHSHTLTSIIAGQLEAGFVLDGFYEDSLDEELSKYFNDYFSTKALKR
ncbi:class I SAM-dependent methyltransferase [Photobacterium sanctipauli]|uniref:Class I SAM-dependent methyltransferase n=1 Tax=Photobacterium sanctipauli TaxID=1342794 RepID=A0A2T3NN83_9GAMM|nr:class I SAM-dependent methyltransferase [Photobacterium sanctipauli]PSW16976.1 class I SAM-dependent methyltransferase [Photobacterium sanctipauli]